MPSLSANVSARLSGSGRRVTLPKYRRHKASGQALVTLSGRDYYLGPHGTKESRIEYERRVGEWLAAGRQRPLEPADVADLTISQLLARYWRFAESHYRKDGRLTGEVNNIRLAARPLRRLYGNTLVKDFGPLTLKALQIQMIADGLCRRVVNSRISKLKRIFRWGTSEQLVPPAILHGLQSVMGLQRGRSEARETAPICPVSAEVVDATIPHLPPVVADMVRLQRLLGCRPGEVCNLRPCDLDRAGEVWKYRPASHKTEHHGRARLIFIGPKAQAVLLPYLLRDAAAYCFSPADSERRRQAAKREARKSKVQPSQVDRSKRRPKRKASDHYIKDSYCRAIARACAAAGVALWTPNRLRHAAATEIRAQFGLEAAQAVLGHSKADVTQVYAERDFGLAARIAQQVG